MDIKVRENELKRKMKIPPLGQRIVKTGVAVLLCLLIHMVRGYRGIVSESCVAAIICMQPFRRDVMRQSIDRVIGTLLGAFWGLLFLQTLEIVPSVSKYMALVYMMMAAGVMITLYSTVVLKQSNTAALAAIVFLSIVVDFPDIVDHPLVQTTNRVIDMGIGILVAEVVDWFSLPREKHPEYIFFVRLQDLVPDRYAHVDSKILVLLNRLYSEGARICLVSKWAPAFLLSQMGTMDINMPVIVMDGAALYDIKEKQYLDVTSISRENARELDSIFRRLQLGYCIYAVQESNMFVYRRGYMNPLEEEDYNLMKRSPYRNYVSGELAEKDRIAFIRIIDSDSRIDEIKEQLDVLIPWDKVRMVRREQPKMPGCSGLYFYDIHATIEERKRNLMEHLKEHGEHGIVPVDMELQNKYISEREAIHLLNKLRDIYEPVKYL